MRYCGILALPCAVLWYLYPNYAPLSLIFIVYSNKIKYIDLARDKSKALVNIYSLLKHIVTYRVMLSSEDNENGEKNNNGSNWKRKTTLHVQHIFFVHFFAVVLHDYNFLITSLHVLWRKCCMCSCSPFFHCRSFSP